MKISEKMLIEYAEGIKEGFPGSISLKNPNAMRLLKYYPDNAVESSKIVAERISE